MIRPADVKLINRWTAGATVAFCVVVIAGVFCSRPAAADDFTPAAAPVDGYKRPPVATVNLPTGPGDHKLKFKTRIGEHTVEMSYLLHLPADYNRSRTKSPMLVFFHGIGECGTDLAGVYGLGPMTMVRADGGNPAFAASCPFVVLCPQCPPRGQKWDDDFMYRACAELVEQTIHNAKVDPERVYATGLSMGGLGTWCVAEEDPDAFAAIAPLSAMKWTPEVAGDKLKYVSVWAVSGVNDESRFIDGAHAMDAALPRVVPQRFTYMVNTGHEAFYPAYASPQFYEWFLSHRKLPAVARKKADGTPPPFPTAPGHYAMTFDTKVGDQPYQIDYVLYIPKPSKTVDESAGRPAMLFLHEQDTMGPVYHDICVHGPDLLLEQKPGLQTNFPFVVISPRLPIKCDWGTTGLDAALLALVDNVTENLHLDPARLYATGLNAGADGAWALAAAHPERFAAVVPVSTDGQLHFPGDSDKLVKNVPGRIVVKPSDKPALDRATQFAGQSKLDWKAMKMPADATPLEDVPAYGDHQLIAWLLQQHRDAPPK